MDDRAFQSSLARLREDAAISCQMALWNDDLEAAERHANEAFDLARKDNDEPSLIAAKVLAATVATARADKERGEARAQSLTEAGDKLRAALDDCRRLGLTALTAKALLARAGYLLIAGQLVEARAQAEEMLSDAERRHLRLYAADMNNLLARISRDGGDPAAARRFAEAARKQAECDGEGWRYQPAWETAGSLLEELA